MFVPVTFFVLMKNSILRMSAIKKIRNELFRLTHLGSKYYCVYCGKSYRRFMHEGVKAEVFKKHRVSGGGYKKNVKCPNCLSVDRSRLLCLFFQLRTKVFHEKTKILHISPNYEIAQFLCQHKTIEHITGALEPERFTQFDAIKIDVQKIDFSDNTFDVVICCHVIEHDDDDKAAMREIFRVLKQKGFAVLQVPLAIDMQTTIEDKSATTNNIRKIDHGQNDTDRTDG